MLKAGVAYADKVNAVSPNYASELLTHLGSHGMEADFQARASDLYGIVNGCDYQDWNPETDPFIKQSFKANKVSLVRGKKKRVNVIYSSKLDYPLKMYRSMGWCAA